MGKGGSFVVGVGGKRVANERDEHKNGSGMKEVSTSGGERVREWSSKPSIFWRRKKGETS